MSDLHLLAVRDDPLPDHPAKYTPALFPIFLRALEGCNDVLDPFAGVGTIFKLRAWRPDLRITAVELQPKWAARHPETIVGNVLHLHRLFAPASFGALLTSPVYGNRMADHHDARDASERNTYRHKYGEDLHPDNAGQLQWGPAYRRFHRRAWIECIRVLRPGGRFILNVKDHVRNGLPQQVPAWHDHTLTSLGLRFVEVHNVRCPGNRRGANAGLRMEYEQVYVYHKEG